MDLYSNRSLGALVAHLIAGMSLGVILTATLGTIRPNLFQGSLLGGEESSVAYHAEIAENSFIEGRKYLNDGDLSTVASWESAQSVILVFDAEKEVEEIQIIFPESDVFYQYKVEASVDGELWNTVIDRTGYESLENDTTRMYKGTQVEKFTKRKAKFIRIIPTYSSDSIFRVREIIVK